LEFEDEKSLIKNRDQLSLRTKKIYRLKIKWIR
jgi:hypothetical protein